MAQNLQEFNLPSLVKIIAGHCINLQLVNFHVTLQFNNMTDPTSL